MVVTVIEDSGIRKQPYSAHWEQMVGKQALGGANHYMVP
jgi:hypothetical protein